MANKRSGMQNTWLWQQRENITTLVVAILLALLLRTFVAEARWIPSESMLPTLEVGDRLIVEKISYRLHAPERGDIVVFYPPEHVGFREAYIKRLIGLPGDRIEVRIGEGVYVNGEFLDEDYTVEPPNLRGYPGGDLLTLGDISQFPVPANTANAAIIVPPDSYFMMGDNRNNSQDSHVWGFVPTDNIIGRTAVRFWPPQRLGVFGRINYAPPISTLQPQ